MILDHISSQIESEVGQKIIASHSQSGGDINQASIIELSSNDSFFLKWNGSAPEHMFKSESKGLKMLFDAKTELIIPEVILIGKDFLLLSLIESCSANSASDFNFGVQLAKLHRNSSENFGLDHDNFIGKLPQRNRTHKSWANFFIQERIEPQIKLGIDSGKFLDSLDNKIEKLASVVEKLFPDEPPALLHGDLWSGNYMYTTNGIASIYDPAVYYGHREMDLAMTKLFGGFSKDFYEGYDSEYPLEDGFEERIQLCNLYPILVHANLFGGGYVNQAIGIMDRFS
ncbi:MAG: fructosamine kinase family protein [Balneola sp.]